MSQPMMPPPLPGYAAAVAAPPGGYAPPPATAGGYPMPAPPAPQGYPGPAVAAPAPAPAPVYAPQPAPAYAPQPAPAPAPPQHAYNPAAVPGAGLGDIGAAIAAATGGDRAPRFQSGSYLLEVIETIVTQHPVERYLTFKARFRVVESTNPAFREGSEGAYIEGLAYGAGRIQDCLIALAGYPSKAEFVKAYAAAGRDPELELRLLGNACGNPTSPQEGNHYPANPLAGRRVRTNVTEQDKIGGPKSRNAGKPVHFINHVWQPA